MTYFVNKSFEPELKVKTFGKTSSPITLRHIDGETMEMVTDFIFFGSKITADGDCCHEIKRLLAPWKKSYEKTRQCIEKERHHFADKGLYSQSYGLSSCHSWI